MKLSILICHLPNRALFLDALYESLVLQLGEEQASTVRGNIIHNEYFDVEILIHDDESMNVGQKRNELLTLSRGKYISYIDDDDRVNEKYISLLFEGIHKGVDCCSLKGIITENGLNPLIFEHSIKYNEYKTNPEGNPIRYERFPNHLNCIKSSIAKQFRFPSTNHGEDTDWATQIKRSGLIRTEHYIPEVIYYYDWRTK